MSRFDYLLDKIEDASFEQAPFRHVYITNFLKDDDFKAIVEAPEINVPAVESDEALFEELSAQGYKIIEFPGCITDKDDYIEWHRTGETDRYHSSACEGFGVTLRLYNPKSTVLNELIEFLSGEQFNRTLAGKFGLDFEGCNVDNGIQKYLDGYEISPHPDIRRKAATFMVNINPHKGADKLDHHTHYMKLKDEHKGVLEFWEANEDKERCWVPWDWCDDVKIQPENNSIVLFAPGNDTMHAVRARYDHLSGQRTQLYGNLWHKNIGDLPPHDWEMFDLQRGNLNLAGLKMKVRDKLPEPMVSAIRALRGGNRKARRKEKDIGNRTY